MKTKNFYMVRIITFVQQRFSQFGPVLIRKYWSKSCLCSYISIPCLNNYSRESFVQSPG